MKRACQVVSVVGALASAGPAHADPDRLPARGDWVVSAERLFGYAHRTGADEHGSQVSSDAYSFGSQPVADLAGNSCCSWPRVGVDRLMTTTLTLGGSLGIARPDSFLPEDNTTSLLIAVRVGYLARLSNTLAIWPRAGVTWFHDGAGQDAERDVETVTIEAPILLAIAPGEALSLGPTFDIGRAPPRDVAAQVALHVTLGAHGGATPSRRRWTLSVERLFGYAHDWTAQRSGGVTFRYSLDSLGFGIKSYSLSEPAYAWPRLALDRFVTSRISVGGAAGADHLSGSASGDSSETSFLVAARVGLMMPLGERLALWPRAGLTYWQRATESSTDGWRTHEEAVTLEALLLAAVAPHASFSLGAVADVGFGGALSSWGFGYRIDDRRHTVDVGVQVAMHLFP